ncbi:hypothetical protein TNCV_1495771 [Trichonephila clavipes]|nr:hypothetical protein TNCV_1495771 [Trichonephila clavipes]
MGLKATDNDRRHVALCHDEFRRPRSGLCRSGGIGNNNNNIPSKVAGVEGPQKSAHDTRTLAPYWRGPSTMTFSSPSRMHRGQKAHPNIWILPTTSLYSL